MFQLSIYFVYEKTFYSNLKFHFEIIAAIKRFKVLFIHSWLPIWSFYVNISQTILLYQFVLKFDTSNSFKSIDGFTRMSKMILSRDSYKNKRERIMQYINTFKNRKFRLCLTPQSKNWILYNMFGQFPYSPKCFT